jgi:hypothetical protein
MSGELRERVAEALHEALHEEGYLEPYLPARRSNFTADEVAAGKLREADEAAERANREAFARIVEAVMAEMQGGQ